MGRVQAPIWNVPYQRNLLFTGREDVLKRLYEALRAGKTAALAQPQAISGLGGIGKTQTAVEYAYRNRDDYQVILWVKAETDGSIISDFVTIAQLLNLHEKEEQEQLRIVEAVKRWFQEQSGWLLIFDNADDLAMVRDFLPPGDKGHILLTTRAHATGRIAQRIEVEKMEPAEGALFLMHRATILDPEKPIDEAAKTDRDTAREIVQAMDGLPLALEQAGAYIEETGCGLQGYLRLYRAQGVRLLKEHGEFVPDHPKPVATTWSLSFEKVEQANAAAAELLRFCAFLAPDAIPEELFAESAAELGPTLEPVASDPSSFNAAIRELLKYSLVQRDPETQALSIHRLVQEVLKDQIDEETQRMWAERAVRAVRSVFPFPEYSNWDICRKYLLHAQACSTLIERWELRFTEAAILLDRIGYYLWQRGEYEKVEQLQKRALAINEKVLGSEHTNTLVSLEHLAKIYQSQGKYEQAEPLYQRILLIDEKVYGPDHVNVGIALNNLALLYWNQGKYKEAEPLYLRALTIYEKVLDSDHHELATSLNNLALLYWNQGKYEEAEPLYQRSLAISERKLGPDHPTVAIRLNNLALLYWNQGKYEEAEPLYQRALAIREQVLGPDHPDTANSLNNLALLYKSQGKYEQAEPLYLRAIDIGKKILGPEHPDLATWLNNLALLYKNQGKYEQSEPLYQRAIAIGEKTLGPEHPDLATRLNNLAALYDSQGKYEQAEPLLQRALAIRERVLGPEHPDTATSLHWLAFINNRKGEYEQSEKLYLRTLKIYEKALPPDHPSIALTLENYASLLQKMSRIEEASKLEQRARAIRAKRSS